MADLIPELTRMGEAARKASRRLRRTQTPQKNRVIEALAAAILGARDDIAQDEPLTPELFHLDRDPAESYNVADRHPDICNRLEQRLRAFGEEIGARVAPAGPG